jgi:hypothetical protein
MPLRMSATQTDKVFIVGLDDNNNPGVVLLPGQVVTVTPGDTTVIVKADASPLPTDADYKLADGTLIPKGTATQFSGTISFASTAAPNAAVTVTESIKNADGTPVKDDTGAVIADLVDTVTMVPGLLKKEGELFGIPA